MEGKYPFQAAGTQVGQTCEAAQQGLISKVSSLHSGLNGRLKQIILRLDAQSSAIFWQNPKGDGQKMPEQPMPNNVEGILDSIERDAGALLDQIEQIIAFNDCKLGIK